MQFHRAVYSTWRTCVVESEASQCWKCAGSNEGQAAANAGATWLMLVITVFTCSREVARDADLSRLQVVPPKLLHLH